MNKETDANTLHSRLLDIARFFHEFCCENHINYYMLGGTMLGAVRHRGFIPWDDDMDFGIPRDDYERFISLLEKKKNQRFEVCYYKNTSNSPMHYAKLIDTQTTLIENNYHNYVEGLYIDIFPLDMADKGTLYSRILSKRIAFEHALIMNHCSTSHKKGIVRVLVKKYAEMCDLNKLHASLEKLMTKGKGQHLQYVANYLGAWGEKEIVPLSIMGKPRLYEFEGTQLYGVEDYDGYLRSLYNDYMQLPPEDKRVFKHNYYYLSLETPYRDYIAKKKRKKK